MKCSIAILLPAILFLWSSMASPNEVRAAECVHSYGCWYGYCWSRCNDGTRNDSYLVADYQDGDLWCYTTGTKQPKPGERARCNTVDQCNGCWDCESTCRA